MPDDSGFPSSLPSGSIGLAGAGRQAFLNSLSQHARLLTIETPLRPGALVVERFTGREGMSELFCFEVDCVSTSADFELKALTDQEVTLRLACADGSTRVFHGFVSSSLQLGSDGALTRYRLTLVPWMQRLTQRRDNYIFQNKTVLEIIEEVLGDYSYASYRFDVNASLPQRSITMQYRESDYDFIARLLAEEGMNFYFAHAGETTGAQSEAEEQSKAGQARHKFVVFDDNTYLPACTQAAVRFNRTAATETADTVTAFGLRHQVQANAVALASWDYKKLSTTSAEEPNSDGPESLPSLEVYESAGAYRYTDEAESNRIARARAESLRSAQQACYGEGSVRGLAVGSWFTLTGPDHETIGEVAEFAVLTIEHSGANNVFPGVPGIGEVNGAEPGTYRNRFSCVPRTLPIRPSYWKPKPKAPGAQVALVVGVAGEEITTERDHRVKIQFPWQRGEQTVPGQDLHPATSNAPGNETAGTWVRVAEAAAGANWGGNFIPRIGQEIQVDFIAGDIDRPVVTGQVYNGSDMPPFHGADNHPGALAGFKSKEYAGGGYNQWVMDDTPSQLRQGLHSSYHASQLNIGYLIRQNGNVRGSYRGNGFELTTDAWSVLRAKRGLFVTTTQRNQAVSTQLDSEEAQGKLKAAEELAQALSDASVQHQASPLTTPEGLNKLTETLQSKDNIDSTESTAFTTPIGLFDSAAGINIATPASSLVFAGQDMCQTMHTAMRITAGQSVSMVTAKATSFFTHAGGAKVIAGNSPVSFQAHTGPMDVLADQAMTVTSSNGSIKVQAKDEILLNSGGGYIRLKGGDIEIHCPSSVSVKGASHDFKGPASGSVSMPFLPDSAIKLKNWIAINYRDAEGEPMAGIGYKIKFDSGEVISGKLDESGHAHHDNVPESSATVEYEKRTGKPDAPWDSLQKMVEKAQSKFS
ncbi:type VI secretion system secreted protein VgrG [Paucimonas lemoignei]|uniref:Type VI secretion system secreted protein VgrG n=1 Tax=Paucimonas lemoignei TaxID=29443 RepID=A0A4R3I367_PAULE|nr:type VI secretion system Vgr family protein [Paucimonas lemoignei]TCS39483.1 type VI secretion system secreted protein VgrG [Paucimonas lemoignei]